MDETVNTTSGTVSPIVELKLSPKKDGKWGWRWHNTAVSRDFGPTFALMSLAYHWLDGRNGNVEPERNEDQLETETEDSNEEIPELQYEADDMSVSDDTVFNDEVL